MRLPQIRAVVAAEIASMLKSVNQIKVEMDAQINAAAFERDDDARGD
jgi:hypothetical protein